MIPHVSLDVDAILAALGDVGVCVVPGVITPAEAATVRGLLDAIRVREHTEDVDRLGHQRVLHIATKHPVFVELLAHPLCVAVLERFLGADFVCSTWSANTLLSGRRHLYWHVDHPYWTIAAPYPTDPPLTAHVLWCLDDFDASSGATHFVPGSHRRPHLPEHNACHLDESAPVQAPAGSVVFAHGATWHSAGDNQTDRPRTGIFGRYARSYIVLQEDLRAQLAAVNDPSPLVKRLMGADQYTPQRGFPY